MTEPEDESPDEQAGPQIPPWDAAAIMRRRADDARRERDNAIRDLRSSMSDEEVLAEYGLDLGQIDG